MSVKSGPKGENPPTSFQVSSLFQSFYVSQRHFFASYLLSSLMIYHLLSSFWHTYGLLMVRTHIKHNCVFSRNVGNVSRWICTREKKRRRGQKQRGSLIVYNITMPFSRLLRFWDSPPVYSCCTKKTPRFIRFLWFSNVIFRRSSLTKKSYQIHLLQRFYIVFPGNAEERGNEEGSQGFISRR